MLIISCSASFLQAFFKDGSRDGLERARMANWRRELRLKMANDDHARSVGWLGDCYWGGVSNAVGCEVNRTLAMRLYEVRCECARSG